MEPKTHRARTQKKYEHRRHYIKKNCNIFGLNLYPYFTSNSLIFIYISYQLQLILIYISQCHPSKRWHCFVLWITVINYTCVTNVAKLPLFQEQFTVMFGTNYSNLLYNWLHEELKNVS